MSNGLEDSGEVRQAASGAHRDSSKGKGRYDLISPIAIARLARINELGGINRGDRNWERGMPLSWFIDSALRHIFQYLEGKPNEDHLAQCFWNIMCAMHTEEMISRSILPAKYMDLPNYQPPVTITMDWRGTPEAIAAANPIHESTVMGQAKSKLELLNRYHAGRSWPKEEAFTVSKPLRFYVGGPFSDDDPAVREMNTVAALRVSTLIARRGHFVLSPHAATGYLDGIMPYEYFMQMDFSQIIAWSNAYFHIADSPGANRERELSQKKGNPIFTHIDQVPFVEPNNYVPLDEQQPAKTPTATGDFEQPGKGRRDGDADLRQADPPRGSDQAVHGPHRSPTQAECEAAEESRP